MGNKEQMMAKKWYVFDEFDCFCGFDTAGEAADMAADMDRQGYTGIEIRHFTRAEFMAYCAGGTAELKKLRVAAKVSV